MLRGQKKLPNHISELKVKDEIWKVKTYTATFNSLGMIERRMLFQAQ